MSLKDQLEADVKDAMRSGDALRRDTLRMVLAAMKNRRIELGEELDDEQQLAVLRSNVKSRVDSAQQYEKAGRDDLATKEAAEIEMIEGYLPKMMSESNTKRVVEEAIAEVGAASKKDMGRVIKAVMAKHKGLVDGKLVQGLAAGMLE
ncbi:MAG: GatB/YqeY domain-containing protein [bacterium]|nr:GatB/YqeY domain-containing protein [bacterium]